MTIVDGVPCCDACGESWRARPLNMLFGKNGKQEILCSRCQGYIDANMLRLERVDTDGRKVYRWWAPEWKPGQLAFGAQEEETRT